MRFMVLCHRTESRNVAVLVEGVCPHPKGRRGRNPGKLSTRRGKPGWRRRGMPEPKSTLRIRREGMLKQSAMRGSGTGAIADGGLAADYVTITVAVGMGYFQA